MGSIVCSKFSWNLLGADRTRVDIGNVYLISDFHIWTWTYRTCFQWCDWHIRRLRERSEPPICQSHNDIKSKSFKRTMRGDFSKPMKLNFAWESIPGVNSWKPIFNILQDILLNSMLQHLCSKVIREFRYTAQQGSRMYAYQINKL